MLAPVVLLAVLLLAACGGGDEAGSTPTVDGTRWSGPAELRPAEGVLDVDDFDRHAESVDEAWERDPELLAREFLRVQDGEADVADGRVVVTRDNLQDDSVRAERWVLELERDSDGWRLRSARWEQRCHVGRGHQSFGNDLCL